MTSHTEEEKIVSLFEANVRTKDLVLFDCTSGYPVSYEGVYLLEITRLRERYGGWVEAIGFSGHHLGIIEDKATYTLERRSSSDVSCWIIHKKGDSFRLAGVG